MEDANLGTAEPARGLIEFEAVGHRYEKGAVGRAVLTQPS